MNGATPGVLEIHQSLWKMIAMAVILILTAVWCASVVFHLLPDVHPSSFQELVMRGGVVVSPVIAAEVV